MKKLLMSIAVVVCVASVVQAQVYSANIVGYNKDISEGGVFHISGVQFEGSTDVRSVYGDSLPMNSIIYVFDGSAYAQSEYKRFYDAGILGFTTNWTPNVDLGGNIGFWVSAAGSGMSETTIAGEVPLVDAVTNTISIGFQLVSYPYPVEISVRDMGFSATMNDIIYVFDGSAYAQSEYKRFYDAGILGFTTNWTPNISVPVGSGFWYSSGADTDWVATRPFTP